MGTAANNLKDEGMRMVRHASDEGKSAALKVINKRPLSLSPLIDSRYSS